jgi:hypothetical protein
MGGRKERNGRKKGRKERRKGGREGDRQGRRKDMKGRNETKWKKRNERKERRETGREKRKERNNVYPQTKHTLTTQLVITSLEFIQVMNSELCAPPKNLRIEIQSCFSHKCPNLEATKTSFNRSVDK